MARSRPLGSRSFAVLCELLVDEDELVRCAVCCELGARGHEAARAVGKLVRAAGYDDKPTVRSCALVALSSIAAAGDDLDKTVLDSIKATRKDAEYPESAFLARAQELVELAVWSRSRA